MSADLQIVADEGDLALHGVHASEGEPLAQGDPKLLRVVNSGTTTMARISVGVTDEGRPFVQLARDEDGQPGVWASAGEPIVPTENYMAPGASVAFWSRAVFSMEDREGTHDFEFVLRGTSIGS